VTLVTEARGLIGSCFGLVIHVEVAPRYARGAAAEAAAGGRTACALQPQSAQVASPAFRI
jgi:hypothetical protein